MALSNESRPARSSSRVRRWIDSTFLDLGRQFRWSFLPPLLVYFAAGISGLTGIVGTFFVKDYLGLSASFLAGLSFWAGLPWALKMPLGHLVDLIWRWKAALVYVGATLIALSLLIFWGLIAHTEAMVAVAPIENWYVLAVLLSPTGYVVQDVVADAMTVEAVPALDHDGRPFVEADKKAMHTTMQTLGRVAILSGLVAVALLNLAMFSGLEGVSLEEKSLVYARVYLIALVIPLISVLGVFLGSLTLRRRAATLRAEGVAEEKIDAMLFAPSEPPTPNPWIFGGSAAFVVFTLTMGLSDIPFAQEIVFAGSMAIVLFLMQRLLLELDPTARRTLIGTAVIIFVFRAVPLPGPGLGWFEIDVLGFDESFFSLLSLITSVLALAGMVILRPAMSRRSIAWVAAVLTIAGGVLALPNIGLYYGVQEWTARMTGGVVDARFIAILDTAAESPLGQISMIPMLAWIARSAPAHLKATFFAVMASFTNLALSASSLATRWLNEVFVVGREVRDRVTGEIQVVADYADLGTLLIVVALAGLALPLLTIGIVQASRFHTEQ